MITKTDIPLRAIQFIIFAILLCTAIAGSIRQAKGKNTAEVQSALLNPKYTAAVTQIQLQQESDNLRLTLKRSDEGFWTGTLRVSQSASAAAESTASAVTATPAIPDSTPTVPAVPAKPGTPAPGADLIFPADTLKIQNLLAEYGKVRNMYIISDNLRRYFLPDKTLSLTFSGKTSALHTQKNFSELYFASAHSPCIVHSAQGTSVYRIDDELCGFLSLHPASWLDPKLFCDFILNGKTEADVQKIQYTQFQGAKVRVQKILASGDSGFDQTVHELLSAQSLKIGLNETAADDASNITQQSAAVFENRSAIKITLFFNASHTAAVFLYPIPTAEDVNSAAEYTVIPADRSLSYSLRISAASFERMCVPFIR